MEDIHVVGDAEPGRLYVRHSNYRQMFKRSPSKSAGLETPEGVTSSDSRVNHSLSGESHVMYLCSEVVNRRSGMYGVNKCDHSDPSSFPRVEGLRR